MNSDMYSCYHNVLEEYREIISEIIGTKVPDVQSVKSHLFEFLFKKNGYLAVTGSYLGLELTPPAAL